VLGADWAKDRVVPSIAPEARRLVEDARAAGRHLVLVSESIDEIARPAGEALSFDRVIANHLEWDEDGATGALREPMVGAEIDPKRLRELASREGVDLARSCAYGAQRADEILLSLVGLPCAIDPDRELARIARDLDWPVVHTSGAS
jgi:phosphoserine phosphatase